MIAPTVASTHQFTDRMRTAFAGLTTIQQQALYLTTVEHLPVGAVAWKLGLPTEAAERIASAARFKVYEAVGSR